MWKRYRGSEAAAESAPPILVTDWCKMEVEGGVLFVPFWSGPQRFVLSMGPKVAFDGIDRARKALQRGVVVKMLDAEQA